MCDHGIEEGGGAGPRRTDLTGFDGQRLGVAEKAASSLLPPATDARLARPRARARVRRSTRWGRSPRPYDAVDPKG